MKIFLFITFKQDLDRLLCVRFDKIDGLIRVYNGCRYLVLLGSERYDTISNKIRCLTSQKRGISYVFSLNYARSKVDSHDPLILTLHIVVKTLISIVN